LHEKQTIVTGTDKTMKNKHVILLVIAGVVLGTLAWMTSREQVPAGANRIGQKLMPDLAVNAVDEIIIATGAQTARVAKVDNAWVVPERYGYPAKFETIRGLMLKLADLKIGQAFKAGDRQRAQMDLTPEAATTLTLKAGGNTLAVLRLGADRQAGQADMMPVRMGRMTDGRYLAINGDPMVYLVGDSLHEAATDPKRWMDTSLLDVSADSVTTISLTNPEDGTFALVKGADGKLAFEAPEEGKPFDEAKNWSLTGALGYLTLQDVADPAADDAALGFSTPRTFSMATTNGTTYTLRVSDPIVGSDERYVRIAVAFNAPPLPPTELQPEAKTENEAATDEVAIAAEANRQAEAAAKALHAKLSPWTFRIAVHKAGTLASSRESLVKQPKPAADAPANDLTDQTDPADPADPADQTDLTAQPNQPETEETTDEQ
jgi:hypothetical protein